jgi:hypothetical protein
VSIGTQTQRIGDVLAALYALEEKYWVNIPELIWKQLHKCWEDMIENRLESTSQRPLHFDSGIPIPKGAL